MASQPAAVTMGPPLWVACLALVTLLCLWLASLASASAAMSPTAVAVAG